MSAHMVWIILAVIVIGVAIYFIMTYARFGKEAVTCPPELCKSTTEQCPEGYVKMGSCSLPGATPASKGAASDPAQQGRCCRGVGVGG